MIDFWVFRDATLKTTSVGFSGETRCCCCFTVCLQVISDEYFLIGKFNESLQTQPSGKIATILCLWWWLRKLSINTNFVKLLREVLYINIFQICQKSNHSNFGKDAQFFSIVIICLKDSVNKPWSRYYGDQKKYL